MRKVSIPITTARLQIRAMAATDSNARYRLHADPDYIRFVGATITRDASDRQLESEMAGAGSQWRQVLAISDRTTHVMLGECALIYGSNGDVELVIAILPEARHCGRAREAAVAATAAVFGDTNVQRVIGKVAEGNSESLKLVHAIGMSPADPPQEQRSGCNFAIFEATRESRGA